MKCAEVETFIDRWEAGQDISGRGMGTVGLKEHLASCPSCSRRFGGLLPFMERETRRTAAPANTLFVDTVMNAIEKENYLPMGTKRAAATRWYPALAAALLVAVFAAGFLSRGILAPTASGSVTVRFTFSAPEAQSVVLVGSFPDWSVNEGRTMKKNPDGKWELNLKLKKNGVYTYNFLVDGNSWIPDPNATEAIDDGFGGTNSLLRI